MENIHPSQAYIRQLPKCLNTEIKYWTDLKNWLRITFYDHNWNDFEKINNKNNRIMY